MPPPVSGRPGDADDGRRGRWWRVSLRRGGGRLDRAGIDAGELRHAPRQRGELHRLQEGDQQFVVRLVHREVLERHLELRPSGRA